FRYTVRLMWIASIASADTPADLLRSIPLRFEKVDEPEYQWVARGSTYAVAFGGRDTLIAAGDRAVRLTLQGSQAAARFEASGPAATQYFRGRSGHGIATYTRLRRTGVQPGIDLPYY